MNKQQNPSCCVDCVYWNCTTGEEWQEHGTGECHRHPPKVFVWRLEGDFGSVEYDEFQTWPETLAQDFCGESLAATP